jgi:hypothetical protein
LSGADNNFIIHNNISQGLGSDDLSAHSHTPQAANTEIVISYKKWFVLFSVELTMYIAGYIFFEADVFGYFTQFTKIKLRTATFLLGNIG